MRIFCLRMGGAFSFYHECYDYVDYHYNKYCLFSFLFQVSLSFIHLLSSCRSILRDCALARGAFSHVDTKLSSRVASSNVVSKLSRHQIELPHRMSSNFGSKQSSRVERPHTLVYRMPRTPKKGKKYKNNLKLNLHPILKLDGGTYRDDS